jgi:predicted O-methyltransferase YrrM
MKLKIFQQNKLLFEYAISDVDKRFLNQFTSIKKAINGNTLELMNKIQGLDVLLGNNYEPNSILETCAGMGFSAHYFRSKFPNSKIVLNEIKPELVSILKNNFTSTCFNCLESNFVNRIKHYDLIFIDFPNFTFCYKKQREPIYDLINLLSKKSQIIIMTGVFSYAASISKKLDINKYIEYSNSLLNKFNLQITEIFIYENKKVELMKIEKINNKDVIFHYGKSNYFEIKSHMSNQLFDI